MIFDLSRLNSPQRHLITRAVERCTFDFDRLKPKLAPKESIAVSFRDLQSGTAARAHANSRGHEVAHKAMVMGLAFDDGRIHLERELVHADPKLAQEVFLAEAAHMVDFFLLEDEDREQIIDAFWGKRGPRPGWWAGSYERQIGEHFMEGFVQSFSDLGGRLEELARPITFDITRTIKRVLNPSSRINDIIRAAAGR